MYKKILMPVDVFDMDLSDKAIRHAQFLASADQGEITLINVIPQPGVRISRGFASDIKKYEMFIQAEAEKKMQRLSQAFDIPPARLHTRVQFGNIRDEINQVAQSGGFDVIVIGSRKPGITTHLLGSNAESILRYASVPVLVIR